MLLFRHMTSRHIFGALVLSLAFSVPAHAKDTAEQLAARRAIAAQYALKDQGMQSGDIAKYSSVLAPDFEYYGLARIPITRERHLAMQDMAFKLLNLAKSKGSNMTISRSKIRRLEWRGPDAIVMMQASVDANQKNFSYHTNFITRDYWGLIGGKWQLRQSADVKFWGSINGESFSYE